MNRLVAIVGPTAVGKSQLAVRLVQSFDGEIVSADSRQIYRHMDIGTAKPTPDELALIPHHLISIVDPNDDFNLAQYQQLAYEAIKDIQGRNKLALLVGGSGQYVWSVLEGWEIPRVPPDEEFRRSLEERAAKGDKDGLYQKLVKIDPIAARRTGSHNVRRIIRALEVYRTTGTPPSKLQRKKEAMFQALIIGLTMDRTGLYHIIDTRVDHMIEQGLVDEVRRLMDMGYELDLPAMSSIGYKQAGMFIKGELTLTAAIERIKKWFDVKRDNIYSEIKDLVAQFLKVSTKEEC